MTDQHAAHLLSCAGATHVATPALDALAAGGTRFTRAYTTFPLCVPSRASMLTGRHPHELGVNGNSVADAADGPREPGRDPGSLGHRLRELGYETAYAGKWHALQASAAPEDGFEVVAPFGDRGLAEAATTWLRLRSAVEAPFALVVSFDDPHSICEYARHQPMPYGEMGESPPTRDLPPLPANHGPTPYEPEALRHEQREAAAMYGTSGYGPDDWRRYRHAYARLVERADAGVGVVLAALEDAGLADDTVVVYTSDHGDGDASHAWNQKTALFEETCRVPLIVRDPRRPEPVATSPALVSVGLDLLPTALSVAADEARQAAVQGVPPRQGAEEHLEPADEGLDLMELLDGRPGHREVVVETAFGPTPGRAARALVTEKYKYVVFGWGAYREQLFDLETDPGEMRNLAMESASDAVLEDLRARLLHWCRSTDDTRFLKRLVLPAGAPPEVHREIFAVPY
ncbi:MAG: sulfatase-like hydrolase/transferase [Humibacillus sp.]|nr:sulfatase-like hydrolase/transferase [Humibacillus sp.]MDN5775438.1 sulfatase-like hydrolase/transferase [Humibacillus sp.]